YTSPTEISTLSLHDALPIFIEREVSAAVERKAARIAQDEYLRRLGSIFDSALDAVVTMDADGVITDWNPMAETIFGWPKSEAVRSEEHTSELQSRGHLVCRL